MAISFNVEPYYDDFESVASGNTLSPKEQYQRILFRPGKAIQARELTQLQTQLQHQISSHGTHVFKDGSVVVPGAVHLHNKIDYVKLDSVNSACDTVAELVGTEFTDGNNVAKVVHATLASGSDPITLFVKYISGTTFADNAQITASGGKSAEVKASGATGFGAIVAIEDGIYYIKKHFVTVKASTIVLSKYSTNVSFDIGLLVTESLVSSGTDASLNDNATGTPNESAPGAHRYSITAALSSQAVNATSGNFVLIARLEDGYITKNAATADYNHLADELARRTFDESGNYYVNPFKASVKDYTKTTTAGSFITGTEYKISTVGTTNFTSIGASANTIGLVFTATGSGSGTGTAVDQTKLTLGVEPSKAYVRGYEIETLNTTNVDIDKARTSELVTDKVTEITHNNFIEVTNLVGVPDITTFGRLSITNGSAQIATARPRSIERVSVASGNGGNSGDRFRIHIFDFVQVHSTLTMTDATHLVAFDNAGSNEIAEDFAATIATSGTKYNIGPDSLIYKLPYDRIKTCNSVTDGGTPDFNYRFETNRIIAAGGAVSGGSVTFTTTVTGEVFGTKANNTNWILINDTDDNAGGIAVDVSDITLNSGSTTATINVGTTHNGDTVRLIAPFIRTGTHKSKTLSPNTAVNFGANTDYTGTGQPLGDADVHELVSVTETTGGADVTTHFELDNGQRDDFYDLGRIKLKTTSNYAATKALTITYKYFIHGATGDFFTVDSYTGQIDYEDIPKQSGIELRSAVDFRPRIDDSGGNFNTTGANLSVAPTRFTQFETDIQFYLPRIDKVYLNSKGGFGVAAGIPARYAEEPDVPNDSMHLYTLNVPAYTLTADEVTIKFMDHRRYTMRDIGRIDKRIGQIEYYSVLSFLESEAQNKQILDGALNPRWKSGYLVDAFANTRVSNSLSPEYRASIDMLNRDLRPGFAQGNAALAHTVLDSATNTVKTGDLVTLPYTHTPVITQGQYSGSINVNPYDVFNWTGGIKLTPSTDEWRDVDRRPEVVINNDAEFDAMMNNLEPQVGTIWGEWSTNWTGRRWVGQGNSSSLIETGTSTRTGVTQSIEVQTSRFSVGDRIVEVNFIPFMRTRLVEFEATRMKPGMTVYAFFDGVSVTDYVKEGSYSYEPLVGINSVTAHPGGAGPLTTDANGAVSGTFLIPNNSALNFKTGEKEFKLTSSSTNDDELTETSATAMYNATGLIETRENVIVSTRTPILVRRDASESVSAERTIRRVTWGDPLAQSILLDKAAFVTKLDLYFTTKDANIPVQIQIREMVNGFPTQKVVPFSDTTLNPGSVNIDGTATTFTFESPVYLQDGVEYAITVISNSNKYNVRYGQIGDEDQNGNRISQQPYAGVLFKSQNASTWTADQNKDLMFTLHRAVFSTTAKTAILRNSVLPSRALINNPITTTSGSQNITVAHRDHGMVVGESVTLAGLTATLNGHTTTHLNKAHTITAVTRDSYTFVSGGTGSATGIGGGSAIQATQNLAWDTVKSVLQNLVLPDTAQTWTIKDTAPGSSTTIGSTAAAFVANQDYTPGTPKVIKAGTTHTVELTGTFTTTTDYLSPVLDMERSSLITVSNRIDNSTTVAETDPSKGSNLAKYVTKTVELNETSDTLKIYLDVNRPSNTFVDLYYKVGNTAGTFDAGNWIAATPAGNGGQVAFSDGTTYNETEYEITPATQFTIFAVKIVMRSTGTSFVPKCQDLRIIALRA